MKALLEEENENQTIRLVDSESHFLELSEGRLRVALCSLLQIDLLQNKVLKKIYGSNTST
jgi:hypothetical protein